MRSQGYKVSNNTLYEFQEHCQTIFLDTVVHKFDSENTKEREMKGLVEACLKIDTKSGTIVTLDQKEELEWMGIKIHIGPIYEYFLAVH